jgi:signal transduction histidine kinase
MGRFRARQTYSASRGNLSMSPDDRRPGRTLRGVATAARALSGRAHQDNPLVVDGMLALLVTGLALGSLAQRLSQADQPSSEGTFGATGVPGMVLLLAGTLSLTWRRRAPLPVLAVSGAAFIVSDVLESAPPPLPFAPLIALFTVSASRPPVISGTAAGVFALSTVTAGVAHGPLTDDDFLDYLLSVVAAWMLGYGVRLSRARMALLEEQSRQLAREQAARTQQAVEQEQARIGRELHDIVAHNVVVIVAQAGAAKRVFDAEPDQARQALGSIETIGREALIEMRRLLGVLWADQSSVERAPQPGLAELPALLSQMERAGLPVELAVHGTSRPLPPGVELNAYRIVQEALTNALKHAGRTRARVDLDYHTGLLELRVSDNGRGAMGKLTAGHGLVGMRQRAAVLGGEVVVGPAAGGGFEVTAKLPVNGERP